MDKPTGAVAPLWDLPGGLWRGFAEAGPGSSSRPIHVHPLGRWRGRPSRLRFRWSKRIER